MIPPPCQGAGKYAIISPRLVPSQISSPIRMAVVDAPNPSMRGCWKIHSNSSVCGVDDGDVRGFLRRLVVAMPRSEDHRAVA